uniref:Tripartite tricarboxylate transporter TctB family protein n=1 Tax=Bosea sp. NBC_00436 TaxID=2969620 RepID=A0A9E8CJP7_9HYPH
MINRNIIRALFVIAVALAFGIGALRYNLGTLAKAGPGLFPFTVSLVLGAMGLISLFRAKLVDPVPMSFPLKGISVILLSFFGFAAVSQYVNMIAGIVFLVFMSSLAGSTISISRNVKISVGLIILAVLLKNLFNLNLPLI